MARAAIPGRLTWQKASVVELISETAHCRSIVLEIADWSGHRAGQHVDLRLTSPDGYQAQRSYSIASAPEDGFVVLTVERVSDGEVSSYLIDELRVGDAFEIRGPIGGYFVWDDAVENPVMLIAGGSGIAPFRSMLRHRVAAGGDVNVRLLYSARSLEEVIYKDELMRLAAYDEIDIRFALTRMWPKQWRGHRGRIDEHVVKEATWSVQDEPTNFVCGPSGFVETVSKALIDLGHVPAGIKTERFGPSGGRDGSG